MTAIQPAPPRIGMMGTALAHGVLIALVLVAAQRAKPATNIVYEVNLVAAPLPNPAVHNAAPVTRTPVVPAPGERPSTGQDVVTLSQPGISFPYPEYLRNIENKIFAQWNHSMFRPGLDVQIAFVIMKDGSVNMSSVETTKSSRNSSYDLNARAAIEAAANARAFGPLPSGWNGASLPIIFDFAQVPRGAP